MINLLISNLKQLDTDDQIRVVVLTAKGKYFCTGMDLGGASEGSASDRYFRYQDIID